MVKEHFFNIVYIQLGKSNEIDSILANIRSIQYNGSKISTCLKNKFKFKQQKFSME